MPSIVALHNITPSKLRFASKLGGLPCPSIAYINSDHLFDSFGDISFLCSKELANPASRSLYVCDSDIYSSRFPSLQYSVDEEELKAAASRASEISKMFSTSCNLISRMTDILESDSVNYLSLKFHQVPELFVQFQEEVLGKTFNPDDWPKEPKKYDLMISEDPRIQAWVNQKVEKTQSIQLDINDPDIERLKKLIIEVVDDYAQKTAQAVNSNLKGKFNRGRDYEYFKAQFMKDYFHEKDDGNFDLIFRILPQLEKDYRVWSRPFDPLSEYELVKYIRNQENDTKLQFESWVSERFGHAITDIHFNHETPSGNIKKKRLSLEALTSSMKAKMRGGENFNYGAGNIRAQVATYFTKWRSLESEAYRLTSEEDFEKTKSFYNDQLSELIEELFPYYRFQEGNKFMKHEDITEIISEYAGGRFKALEEGFDLSDDFPKENIDAFLGHIKHAPTQYFEGKFKRAVKLSEFSAAIIPDDLPENSKDIINLLESEGIPYSTYRRDDPDNRIEVIKKVSEEMGLSRKFFDQGFSLNQK